MLTKDQEETMHRVARALKCEFAVLRAIEHRARRGYACSARRPAWLSRSRVAPSLITSTGTTWILEP